MRGRSFLLLPFRNVTRSPDHEWLVEGSITLLADVLSQWQEVTAVPAERVMPALRRHGLTPGDVMDEDRVRRVAEETGGWTVVTGDVLATGGRVRVTARAYDVVTNRELVRAVREITDDADILSAFDQLASELLEAAGLQAAAPDLAVATTQSLDAYKAYVRGIAHLNRSEYRGARAAFLEATELDSTFAQAYAGFAMASWRTIAALLDPANPAARYAQRAAELAGTLPPRERALVRGANFAFHGQFLAARSELEQLIAADSADLDAMEWLALVELMDGILVEIDGAERIRGSVNNTARLAKRVLNADPSRHQTYELLTAVYALAAGLWTDGWMGGYRREYPSVAAMLMAGPVRGFRLILRDTIELVPDSDSVLTQLGVEWETSRRRAAGIAQAWVDQWVAAGPTEAAAHLWASRVYELVGLNTAALEYLDAAESLGVESDLENKSGRRVVLLAKVGRVHEAAIVADSLLGTGYFGALFTKTPFNFHSALWATHVYLLTGQPDKVAAVVDAHGSVQRLCGIEPAEFATRVEIPDTLGAVIADAVIALMREGSELPLVRRCLVYALVGAAVRAGRPDFTRPAFDNFIEGRELDAAVEMAVVSINWDTTVAGRLEVFEQLRRIVEIEAANLGALYHIGKIGALTGQELDVAQASLEEYLQHPPRENGTSHAGAHWRLGMIHEHRGDYDGARAAYEESLRLDPEFAAAKAALEKLEREHD